MTLDDTNGNGYADAAEETPVDTTTVDAQSAAIAETNQVVDAKQWMAQDPLNNGPFADIAAAANDAFAYLESNYSGGVVTVPNQRWTINEPVVIPEQPAGGAGAAAPGSFGLVGSGTMHACRLVAGSSFPSNRYLVETEYTGGDPSHNYVIANLRFDDTGSVITGDGGCVLVDSVKNVWLQNLFLNTQSSDQRLRIESADTGRALGPNLYNIIQPPTGAGGTIINYGGGTTHIYGSTFATDGTGGDIALEHNGERMFGHFNIEAGETGLKLGGNNAWVRVRVEGAVGPTNQTVRPIYFTGNSNHVSIRGTSPQSTPATIANSQDEGYSNEIITEDGVWQSPILEKSFSGVQSSPTEVNLSTSDSGTTSTSGIAGITLDTGATSGSESRLDFGGSGVFTWWVRSKCIFEPLSNSDVNYLFELFSNGSNKIGIRYNTTLDTNWTFIADSGGAAVGSSPVDSGISYSNSDIYVAELIQSYDPIAGQEKITCALKNLTANGTAATHTFDTSLSAHEPRVGVTNSAAASKQLSVKRWDVSIRADKL